MSERTPGRDDERDPDRIALDGDEEGDLDEALQEAVEAVEAAEAARSAGAGGEGRTDFVGVAPVAAVDDDEDPLDPNATVKLRLELDQLRERSTRTLADFDNYRKRVERERQSQQRYSGMEVLRGLLDIVDNLERALASDGPIDDLKAGVELTLRQVRGLMRRHGVSRIEADGKRFDPSVHEAVSRHEEEGLSEPTVTAVLQSGYKMHERLLRPVRVAVAVPADGEPPGGGSEEA